MAGPLARGEAAQDPRRLRVRGDAERVLAAVHGAIAKGRTFLPADPRGVPTLGELVAGAKGFLERRKVTHPRTRIEDASRWRKHLGPWFARLRPSEADTATIRGFIAAELAAGVNPATIRILVALLSSLYVDLEARGLADRNPARGLPATVRRLMKPTHDP